MRASAKQCLAHFFFYKKINKSTKVIPKKAHCKLRNLSKLKNVQGFWKKRKCPVQCAPLPKNMQKPQVSGFHRPKFSRPLWTALPQRGQGITQRTSWGGVQLRGWEIRAGRRLVGPAGWLNRIQGEGALKKTRRNKHKKKPQTNAKNAS